MADLDMFKYDLKSEKELRLLQEINKILQRESLLNIRHHSHITEVLKGCKEGVLNWHKDNTPRSNLSSYEENETGKRRLSSKSGDESISPTNYQGYAQTLTYKIRDHNSEMVEDITNLLNGSYHYQNKSDLSGIWGSYEMIFFKSITVEIDNLYVLAYLSDVTKLQRLLPTANPRDMDLRGQWVIDILDPVTKGDALDGTTVLEMEIEEPMTVGKKSIKSRGSKRSSDSSTKMDSVLFPSDDLTTPTSVSEPGQQFSNTGGTERRRVKPISKEEPNCMVELSPSPNLLEEMEDLFPFLRVASTTTTDPEKDLDHETEVPTGRSSEGSTAATEPMSFEESFEQPYEYLGRVLEETLPMVKLKWLVKCLQTFSDMVKERILREHVNANNLPFGADDLLPSLMLFLIKANPGQVTALYPQLKFLADYIPDIVATGIVGYTVTVFVAAFSAIFQSDVANDFEWCETVF